MDHDALESADRLFGGALFTLLMLTRATATPAAFNFNPALGSVLFSSNSQNRPCHSHFVQHLFLNRGRQAKLHHIFPSLRNVCDVERSRGEFQCFGQGSDFREPDSATDSPGLSEKENNESATKISPSASEVEFLKKELEQKTRLLEQTSTLLDQTSILLQKSEEDLSRALGKRWVFLGNLSQIPAKISCHSSLCADSGDAVSSLQALLPPKGARRLHKVNRNPPGFCFQTDVFGSNKQPDHEMAHIVPHSSGTSAIWYPLIQSLLGQSAVNDGGDFLPMLVEGFCNSPFGGHVRTVHSGLINQPFNYITMANQNTYYDQRPSVMFIPALEISYPENWNLCSFDALCVASDPVVCQKIGATLGDLEECDGNDPRVQTAFKCFREAASIIINVARTDSINADGKDVKLSGELRDYFRSRVDFLTPGPSPDPNAKYRIVKFSRGVDLNSAAKILPDQDKSHPAPMPLLLIAKSLNAWLSHLLVNHALDGLVIPKCHQDSAFKGYCSLYPMCDIDDMASCPTCLAKLILRGHPIFDDLLSEDSIKNKLWCFVRGEESLQDFDVHSVLEKASKLLQGVMDGDVSTDKSDDFFPLPLGLVLMCWSHRKGRRLHGSWRSPHGGDALTHKGPAVDNWTQHLVAAAPHLVLWQPHICSKPIVSGFA